MLDSEQLSHHCVQRKNHSQSRHLAAAASGMGGDPAYTPKALCPELLLDSILCCSVPATFSFRRLHIRCLSPQPGWPIRSLCTPPPRAIVYLLEAYDGDIWSRDRGDLDDQPFINGREILIVGTDGRNLTLTKL